MAKKDRKDIRKAKIQYFWKNIDVIVCGCLIGAGLIVWEIKMLDKCMCVKEQTEEYEKTLPGYTEQKQMVEHYRDSLMHAKGR